MSTSRPIRNRTAAVAVVAALGCAACGGSDDSGASDEGAPGSVAIGGADSDDSGSADSRNELESVDPSPDDEQQDPEEQGADVGPEATADSNRPADTDVDPEATTDSAPPEDTTSGEDSATAREEVDVRSLPAGTAQFSVLGGIEFELLADARALVGTGCVLVEQPGYAGGSPFPPNVIVAGVVASGRSAPVSISTVDDWLALYEGETPPVPNGEELEVLGLQLDGYSIDGAFTTGPPPDNRWLNCTANPGASSTLAVLPSGHAEVFVAETDGALVLVASNAFTEEEVEGLRPFFDRIVSTLRATEA